MDSIDEVLAGYEGIQAGQEAFYKDLHAHPELSHAEHRTAERVAGKLQEYGFSVQAAELTPEPARRAGRALAAAQAKHQAGAPDAALRLLAMAQARPPAIGRQGWRHTPVAPCHSMSSSCRLVLASSMSSSPPPDRTVLVAYRVKPLISP